MILLSFPLLGGGGPIVSDVSLENAKIKFEKALSLSCAVDNLLFFKKVKSNKKVMRANFKPEVTYLEVA